MRRLLNRLGASPLPQRFVGGEVGVASTPGEGEGASPSGKAQPPHPRSVASLALSPIKAWGRGEYRRLWLTLALAVPLAPALAFPPRLAPSSDVVDIAREYALPPIRPGEAVFRVDQGPFLATTIKAYAADVPFDAVRKEPEKYKLRSKVLNTFQTIRDVWATTPDLPLPKLKKPLPGKREKPPVFLTRVNSPISAAFKETVKAYQVFPAVAMLKIETDLAELQSLAPLRAREPKRWQAHYDYAVAQCQARLVFLHEYDLALGNLLREELPDLDMKKGHDGWRLVSSEKLLSKRDVKAMNEAAQKQFEELIADHKGTPWAAHAARELATPPGLKWEAFGGKDMK